MFFVMLSGETVAVGTTFEFCQCDFCCACETSLLFDVSGFCATIQLERQVRFQVQLVLLLRIIARPHLK